MKKHKSTTFIQLGLISLAALGAACSQPHHANLEPAHADMILINQHGYAVGSPKTALIRTGQPVSVKLVDSTGKTAFTIQTGEPAYWDQSGDQVAMADFSSFQQKGRFHLVMNDTIVSHPVIIDENPYHDVAQASIRAFYYNRTFIPIDTAHGGQWARPAGHPDTLVYVHESAASPQRPAGTTQSLPLGWYDAGDYNKYVVNSGISTYTLLKALEDYPEYYTNQNLNIPESNNQLPDLLDEALFNLRWVMSMQDPADGGVYHKLTEKNFSGFIMPHKCQAQRFVVMKSTGATLNYAALLAMGSRVLKPYADQLPGLADSCIIGAQKAWDWAIKNPNHYYQQPKDITTGEYGDNRMDDEFYWAACELFLSTGEEDFIPQIKKHYRVWGVSAWGNPGTLGTLSLLKNETRLPKELKEIDLRGEYFKMVDSLLMNEEKSPYKISLAHFDWGSNSDVANHGMLKLIAYQMVNDNRYLHSAINDADYLLGRNATGYCFVTGFGAHRVMNIHHRQSAADGILNPVPGFLAGGPNLVVPNDCGETVERDTFPAKSFVDEACSYSTNEIAINWNAPLAYLLNGIAANIK